jgi:hypothetical protein
MNLFAVGPPPRARRPPRGGRARDEKRPDGRFKGGNGRRSMPAHEAAGPENRRGAIPPKSRDVPTSACALSMTSQPVTGDRASADAMSFCAGGSVACGVRHRSAQRRRPDLLRVPAVDQGLRRWRHPPKSASDDRHGAAKTSARRVDHLRPPSRSHGILQGKTRRACRNARTRHSRKHEPSATLSYGSRPRMARTVAERSQPGLIGGRCLSSG